MEKTTPPSQISIPFPPPTSSPRHEEPLPSNIQKGWYSERIPAAHPSNNTHQYPGLHRHAASSSIVGLMPFNSARRSTLIPSKWDDAERWISSPTLIGRGNSGDIMKNHTSSLVLLPRSERHVKSKSGPLGSSFSGFAYYGNYSPVTPTRISGGSGLRKMNLDSPVDGGRRSCPGNEGDQEDLDCARDWLQMMHHDSLHSPAGSQDDRFYATLKDGDHTISRKEMATEMSDNCRCNSSSNSSSISPQSSSSEYSSAGARIKDVQIDKATSIRLTQEDNEENRILERNSNAQMSYDSGNNVVVTSTKDMKLSKLERERKKIDAWENLQKAKAEAAIHELEMKLERRRSASIEKITKKLRRAEMKAQKTREQLYEGRNREEQHHKSTNSSSSTTTYKVNCFCKCFRMSFHR